MNAKLLLIIIATILMGVATVGALNIWTVNILALVLAAATCWLASSIVK